MYKTVRDHLEAYSGQATDLNYSKLYNKFASSVKAADEEDLQKEFEYRSARQLHSRHLDVLKKVLAEELEKEVERVNGSLPVASVFEALQIAKRAHDESGKRDHGLSNFVGYLETKWKRNRDASITADDYLRMRDHFLNNFPKSKVGAVIEDIGHKGYATLPMTDLMEIASRIASQEDFEYEINCAGLGGNNPHQKKARRFILALINAPESVPTGADPSTDPSADSSFEDLATVTPDEINAFIQGIENNTLDLSQYDIQGLINALSEVGGAKAAAFIRRLKAALESN